MNLMLFLFQFAAAVCLFLLINLMGKYSRPFGYISMSSYPISDNAPAYNFLFRAFSPVVFIVLLSSVLNVLKLEILTTNIFLVTAFYFAFRFSFNVIMGKWKLLNLTYDSVLWLTSISFSYVVYKKMILNKAFLFPSAEAFGEFVWITIIVYLYQVSNNIRISEKRTIERKHSYLKSKYQTYKKKYNSILAEIIFEPHIEALVYSVLIYEAYNRPKLARIVEKVLFKFNLAKTIGIMQVKTSQSISDEESVKIGANKLIERYATIVQNDSGEKGYRGPYYPIEKVINDYNPGFEYQREVIEILKIILSEYYPEVNKKMEEEYRKRLKEMGPQSL